MYDLQDSKSVEKEIGHEEVKGAEETQNGVPAVLQHYSTEELKALEKKLVRKIDFRSLPVLIILFLLNVLDRNAIANARLGGLETTLGITDVQV